MCATSHPTPTLCYDSKARLQSLLEAFEKGNLLPTEAVLVETAFAVCTELASLREAVQDLQTAVSLGPERG